MTQDYKKMTVDECFEALVNLTIDDIGAGRVLIEAQREQAVEEYKEQLNNLSKELFPFQLDESSNAEDCLKIVKLLKQNPPLGWLPITDEQRNGEYWLVAWDCVGWEFHWARYSGTDYMGLPRWQSSCDSKCELDFAATHYLPIDQIPLPGKEQG